MVTRSNTLAFGLCALSIVAGCYANNTPNTKPDDVAEDAAADVKDEGDAVDLDVPTFPDLGNDTAQPDAGNDAAPDVTPADAPAEAATEAAVDAPADVAPDMLCRTRCAGACSDPDTDVHNCGACGNDCALRPGVDMALARCVMGRCDFTGACLPGRANCSGNPDDGCESMLNTPTRCGSCTNVCRDPTPNCGPMTGAPGGYACTSGCVGAGSMRCGTACVDTMTDPRNCGSCGTVCPSGSLGTPACAMGRCTLTCIANYGDCDGIPTNGCETYLRSSITHCGMCGNACAAPPGVSPTCSLGTCTITCATGLGNCDMNAMNGCEANLRTDAMNCGACGTACSGRPNSTGFCSLGSCTLTCNMGYGNCNGLPTDGCEADVSRDPLNCGACARRCAAATNATPTCADSTCGIACNTGYGNCDGNGLNGCETPLQTDARNCGACGTVCPSAAGAAGACVAGRCTLMCMAGQGDCDGMTSNGCETNTNTSNTHCGGCGMACSAPSNASAQCTAGRCVVTCDDGYTLSGSMCVRAAPRPVAPAGGAIATTRRPTFRVALSAGLTGARIEVCGDRLCTAVATTLMATGATVTSSATLAPGVYYWRATGTIAGATVTAASPVTEFAIIAGASAATSSTWGPIFDANADRYVDMLVGSGSLNRVQYWTNSSGTYSSFSYTLISGASGLGSAVAAAGDLNGDGYGDAIFGAPTANVVQVHHGGVSGIVTTPTLTLMAPRARRASARRCRPRATSTATASAT